MAKVAQLNGTHLHTIKIASGVSIHLTTGEQEGDVRVTPEAFGKFLNTAAYNVDSSVVKAIQGLSTPASK